MTRRRRVVEVEAHLLPMWYRAAGVDLVVPDIGQWLAGLPDRVSLEREIKLLVLGWRKYEGAERLLTIPRADVGRELERLGDITSAVKLAQRRTHPNAAPMSLAGRADWPRLAQTLCDTVDAMIAEIEAAQHELKPHRAQRGSQGPRHALDLLAACVAGLLREAGSRWPLASARAILVTCGVPVPDSESGFRAAVRRGECIEKAMDARDQAT